MKCNGCKKDLDIIEFTKNNKQYKLCNNCRDYRKLYYKKYNLEHKEIISKIQSNYKQKNLSKIREQDKLKKREFRKTSEYKEQRSKYNIEHKEIFKEQDRQRMLNRPEYFLYSSARYRAKKKNIEFSITESDIKNLLDKTTVCPLRKTKFERGINHIANDNSLSLDRIDSSKGYSINNIQIISHKANLIKNNINLKIFRTIVNNLKNCLTIEHEVDNDTLRIILNERKQQLEALNLNKKYSNSRLKLEDFLIASAKKRAVKKNLDFNIDSNYLKSIWSIDNTCPILNEKFKFYKNCCGDLSPSLDRIDNTKGYVKGNVRIISFKANAIKNSATIEELEFILHNWEELERNINE